MNILIACEFSGTVRDAMSRRGHHAVSCDFDPSETVGHHYRGDVFDIIDNGWDMLIAFPPCDYLSNSGSRWLYTEPGRWEKMVDGATFFKRLFEANISRIMIENPVMHGHGKKIIGANQDQTFQPWHHGHKETKRTCLWLKNLPLLQVSNNVGPPPKDPEEKKKWAKVHREPPGPNRKKNRSRTYHGVASAIATQWG